MANLSHYGSDNLAEVNNSKIEANYLTHQERQVQSTSEQFSTLAQSNIEINSTLPALQDDLILSMIEQLKTQVVTYTKINQDNKHVNDLLTAELETYKKKESLKQKITILKDDFQKEESRNIDRELALEKEALGFQNPRYLKKAQQLKPTLYDGSVIGKSDVIVVPVSENTLMHAEESRSNMIEKQNDPQMIEKKLKKEPLPQPLQRARGGSNIPRLAFVMTSFHL
nr:hypothetical protein [Tanacetum cinerariifolium]